MKIAFILIFTMLVLFNESKATDKFFIGVWVNVDFSECVEKNKSIVNCLSDFDSPVALSIKYSNENVYIVSETYDLHDSGYNSYRLLCDSNKVFLANNEKSKLRFLKLDSNIIQYKSNIYRRIMMDLDELHQIDKYLANILLAGKYIDIKTGDTLTITNSDFAFSSKNIMKYSLGLDYYDIGYDYIVYNFEAGRIFEESIFIISVKEFELMLYSVSITDEEKYEPNELLYKLIKIH